MVLAIRKSRQDQPSFAPTFDGAREPVNTTGNPDRGRAINDIFERLLAGCPEEEFASFRCPVCAEPLTLHVHPNLHSFFVRCARSSLHLGRHGETEAAPSWWQHRVSAGWYQS